MSRGFGWNITRPLSEILMWHAEPYLYSLYQKKKREREGGRERGGKGGWNGILKAYLPKILSYIFPFFKPG